nr:uncharacterized protein LOC128696360 [Cherax quadricarinatus]
MTSSAKSVRSDIISAISRSTRLRDFEGDLQVPTRGSPAKAHFPGVDTLDVGHTDDGIGSLGGSPVSPRKLAAPRVSTTRSSGTGDDIYAPPQTSVWETRHLQSQQFLLDGAREDETVEQRTPRATKEGEEVSFSGQNKLLWEENSLSPRKDEGTCIKNESRASLRCEGEQVIPGVTDPSCDGGADHPSSGRKSQLSVRSDHHTVSPPSVKSPDSVEASPVRKSVGWTTVEINRDGGSPDFHSQTDNIDIELEIFIQNPEETPESQEVTSRDPAANTGGDGDCVSDEKADATQDVKSLQDSGIGSPSADSLNATSSEDKNVSDEQLLTSVLRSRDGRKVRSSSVGQRVRFRGECCIAESCDTVASDTVASDTGRHNNPTTSRRNRRNKRKIYRSASISNMAVDVNKEANQEYSTLLKEIQALMAEVKKQRQDFRTELRSLTSTINRRYNYNKNCVCSTSRKGSRLPVTVGCLMFGKR